MKSVQLDTLARAIRARAAWAGIDGSKSAQSLASESTLLKVEVEKFLETVRAA